jgi:hypothetical protein
MLSKDGVVTSVAKQPFTGGFYHVHVPKGGTVIFDSIGSGGYDCCSGWTVSAAGSPIGAQYWPAIQITPTASGKLTLIEAGVGFVEGTNSAELAIYADSSGIPGKMLWSGDVDDLPTFGSTSTTTVDAKVKGVKIKANTPFWVAVQTDSNSSNTWDAWNQSETTNAPLAENDGSGWTNFSKAPLPGFPGRRLPREFGSTIADRIVAGASRPPSYGDKCVASACMQAIVSPVVRPGA